VAVRMAVWVVLLPLRLVFGLLLLPLAALIALPILLVGLGIGLAGGVVLLAVLSIVLAPFLLLAGVIWLVARNRNHAPAATPAA